MSDSRNFPNPIETYGSIQCVHLRASARSTIWSLSLCNRQRADAEVPLQQGHGWEWKLQALLELQQTKREHHFCRPCENNRMGRLRTVSKWTNAQQRRDHRMGGQQWTSSHARALISILLYYYTFELSEFISAFCFDRTATPCVAALRSSMPSKTGIWSTARKKVDTPHWSSHATSPPVMTMTWK